MRPISFSAAALLAVTAASAIAVEMSSAALAQPAGCLLLPAAGQRGLRVVQCGQSVTITSENSSAVEIGPAKGNPSPGVTVTQGGVLFEVRPEGDRNDFQIKTPHAIIAVRGTTWAVDVQPDKTEVLVVAGSVAVEGTSGQGSVVLSAGEGVDVPASGPLRAGPWTPERSRALLSRLGR